MSRRRLGAHEAATGVGWLCLGTAQKGTVTKTEGRLALRVGDGRVIPLSQYFCD